MNLAQLVKEYCERDRAKKALTAEQAGLREEIDRELREEYRRTGLNPTLRLPGVGTVLLAGGGRQPRVTDAEAFAEWMAERFPEHVSLVITIPRKRVDSDEFQRLLPVLSMLATEMGSTVDDAALGVLAAKGTLDAGALVSEDGERVEGVQVVDVQPTLSIRPAKG